ncbi:GNAT family N-acetyltransferase [Agrobacterium rosae]|uniref:GNAT family N-acetyltransferase n=1 Tax=Agrobacterium rosae TaxID=1972867 RepID=UPI0019D32453|nr:GNAT family N-acetyltransferase [Agrobacterium rosae]MBN7805923.1 GNAT family N-acetyltransferase [Agrobacterium rosae]
MEPRFVISDSDKESEAAILAGLKAYNTERFGPSDWRGLVISLRDDDDNIIGGLSGHTARGWLYTSLLFIPEEMRGKALGPKLLDLAEKEALKRGCRGAYIDTMSTDALRLYQKCGYTIFGQIEDFGNANTLTYLKKSLS